jgi:uncharacterized protein (DUF1800 family)
MESLWRLEQGTSANLLDWQPQAWAFPGQEWSGLFPHAPAVVDGTFETAVPVEGFFRLVAYPIPVRSDRDMASRFLRQASFGPTMEEIEQLVAAGSNFGAWLDAQMGLPATLHTEVAQSLDFRSIGSAHHKGIAWMHSALDAEDQLRQRMAWALSQILVLGEQGSQNRNAVEEFTRYYDLFVTHAFGNYRDLLEAVTMNPKMARYLTYANNRKASRRREPDENYAREVMQLFTIGLWQLNQDGTQKLDEHGQPIPTYDNEDVREFARVFTGLVYGENQYIDSMRVNESRHDRERKRLLDGSFLPANQDTLADIRGLLDHLFEHPNTPPFISRLLIQRFTCSNPSPAYIGRVAGVFINNGAGVRGDLGATLRAILLDPEARDSAVLADDQAGRPGEPLLKLVQVARSLELTVGGWQPIYFIGRLESLINQHPYRSPSVFNFYLPDYQEQGMVTNRGIHSPEFQIINEVTLINFSNLLHRLVFDGLENEWNGRRSPTATLNLDTEIALADNPDALLDHLDCLLLSGDLSDENRAVIRSVIVDTPQQEAELRVRRALSLIGLTPEFNTLR